MPTLDSIRAQFPALAGPITYLDNAGCSQLPRCVIDAMSRYLVDNYVQLGADYEPSKRAKATVERAHEVVKCLVNAGMGAGDAAAYTTGPAGGSTSVGEVILGPSTSALCNMIAQCYADAPHPSRDEIVVSTAGHESNVGPWVRLAKRGYKVRLWDLDPGTMTFTSDGLRKHLSDRTRLVVFPQVSNILGEIVDVAALTAVAHAAGARVVVDGVAYVPHRAVDVRAWKCDWYVYSTYKVYGPHMAAMFGTREAMAELTGPNHYFIDAKSFPYKFELGGVNHEGAAGIAALYEYLCFLADAPAPGPGAPVDRAVIERAMGVMTELELPVQRRLVEFLSSDGGVRIIGPAHAEASRVSTIAFVRLGKSSAELVKRANAAGLGCRYGSFYSVRLCEQFGLSAADGVVRISTVHYNTMDEVERMIAFLKREFAS
jgi:cysteine desulfurase family protein (TIGR01976 family)